MTRTTHTDERKTPYNSTFAIGGVSCSKDNFVVKQTLVFQIKFCGKSPALRVAAKRYPSFPIFRKTKIISHANGKTIRQ